MTLWKPQDARARKALTKVQNMKGLLAEACFNETCNPSNKTSEDLALRRDVRKALHFGTPDEFSLLGFYDFWHLPAVTLTHTLLPPKLSATAPAM